MAAMDSRRARGFDTDILQLNDIGNYPSVVDRYYRKLYKMNMKGQEGEDYCVLVHSNRICLITLAPSHPILRENKTVSKVDFQINPRTNRLDNHLSGKRKRGAQPLADNSALCIVKCSDGSTYQPCACIKSSLIEANEYLVKNPTLLSTKPETNGYIAIVLTKLQDHKQEIGKLLSPEQYHERLAARSRKTLSKSVQDVEEQKDDTKTQNNVKKICDIPENIDNEQIPSSVVCCARKSNETVSSSEEKRTKLSEDNDIGDINVSTKDKSEVLSSAENNT